MLYHMARGPNTELQRGWETEARRRLGEAWRGPEGASPHIAGTPGHRITAVRAPGDLPEL